MVRACFHVPEMSSSLVSLLLKKIAGVPDGVVRQLQSLAGFSVRNVYPPTRAKVAPKPKPADIHHSTFIAAFLAEIRHGMNDASVMCKYAVVELRTGLGIVERELPAYLQFHR